MATTLTNKRGFTMAELLIVVAIVAVLVAIAIPVFSNQLEKSREATDLANVRSAYAEVMNAAILQDTSSELATRTQGSGLVFQKTVSLKQAKDGWSTGNGQLVVGGISQSDSDHWKGSPRQNGSCRVRWENGAVYLIWGYDHINEFTAMDFLEKDIFEAIFPNGYGHNVINSNETIAQNEGTAKFLEYAKQHGFDLADYGATTWQIHVKENIGNKEFLKEPAIYWSTVDITKVDDGKNVPVMGYRNGHYDVWNAPVTTYNVGKSTEYKSLSNNFANVTNAGGNASFQFDNYDDAKAAYDQILARYEQNKTLTGADMTEFGL